MRHWVWKMQMNYVVFYLCIQFSQPERHKWANWDAIYQTKACCLKNIISGFSDGLVKKAIIRHEVVNFDDLLDVFQQSMDVSLCAPESIIVETAKMQHLYHRLIMSMRHRIHKNFLQVWHNAEKYKTSCTDSSSRFKPTNMIANN